MPKEPLIYIVDDDLSVRNALGRLVRSMGLRARTFASPADFLGEEHAESPVLLVLDVQLPGMSGFDLFDEITASGWEAPVIFITAHPESYEWHRDELEDAAACLIKPFDDETLLEAIRKALEGDVRDRRRPR